MLVGSMNNPGLPLEDELRRVAEGGFDFVDLTLEPPGAWPCEPDEIRRLLADLGLGIVGHTAYYLPIASPFAELQSQAHAVLLATLDALAAAGASVVNVHPDPVTRLFPLDDVRAWNAEAIAALSEQASERGVTLVVENLGRSFGRVEDLRAIFERAPRAGFHLDVAHAHLGRDDGEPNRTRALLDAFGDRLAHVHASDNLGNEDLHLPLGAGTIDWPDIVAALKRTGWNGTVTLEVFSGEPAQLELSRRLWLEWWHS